jgi:hypothetical protein
MDANRAYEMTRSVSKTGEFGLVSKETLDWAMRLTDAEKVSLYCRIRDESQRMESEWRDGFIRSVQIQAESLPEAECFDVDLDDFIRWAKDHSDRAEVSDTLWELLEQASSGAIQRARRLVEETGQDDLLEVFEEFDGP